MKQCSRAGLNLGLEVAIESIENPRVEREEHYYNPAHSGLLELGLEPHFLTEEVATGLLETVSRYRERIDPTVVFPRVRWAKP